MKARPKQLMVCCLNLALLALCGCIGSRITEAKGPSQVKTVKHSDGSWQLLVDGKPYFIKGVVFSPVIIGEDPAEATMRDWMLYDEDRNGRNDVGYDTWHDKNRNNRRDAGEEPEGDFSLLKKMGCNTIRLHHTPSANPSLGDIYKRNPSTRLQYDHEPNRALLRYLHETFGIRVVIGHYLGSWTIGSGASWEEGTDYNNPVHRQNIKTSVRAMVLDHKDQPYLLAWMLGNENNIADWSNCNAKEEPEAYAALVGEIAEMIHEMDPNHPVAVCDGDNPRMKNLALYAEHAPGIDIVAVNSYRGFHGFDLLWKQVRDAFDRPVLISEYGFFAYQKDTKENEELQADYIRGAWRDIERNRRESLETWKRCMANSIGGFVFDWLDRWYMDGKPSVHNPGTDYWVSSPDRLHHEEWFGLVSLGNGSDSFMRQTRKAYDYLAETWNRPD